jgi:hypothetical protein
VKVNTILILSTFCVLLGCASTHLKSTVADINSKAAIAGNPYRWEHKSVNGGDVLKKVLIGSPAPTWADTELESFTREQISSLDNEKGILANQKPQEVRLVSVSESLVQEIWIYRVEERRVVFVVNYQPSIFGGTDINITGPW